MAALGGTGATAVATSTTADTSNAQRAEIGELDNLSAQARAMFDQKPRSSPLQDAQQAFEKKLPNAPRPVDLNNLYVNGFQKKETPPGSGQFTYEVVSSRSVADCINDRYTGGLDIDFGDDPENGITYGIFKSPDAVSDGDKIPRVTPQTVEVFINGLPKDKAKDVNLQDASYFRTLGRDGKTPLQKLGDIRRQQIQADGDLQYNDGTFSKKGRDLVESIVKNPSQADLERAYPDESKRPRVFTLSINPESTSNGKPDADLTLHGPLVMMTPHADNRPGDHDVVVLYLPGQGLKEFNSVADMKSYVDNPSVRFDPEQRHALLNFLSEQAQADLLRNQIVDLGGFKEVPPGRNFFEHSVQQQLDKQGLDTVYRMAQARARGADLNELDRIAGDSTGDLHESFDMEDMLRERDLRVIEHNRPAWWKNSSQTDRDLLGSYQDTADLLSDNLEALESGVPTLKEHAASKIREELNPKYPAVDPDKVQVTLSYRLPPEGSTRTNPNPLPRFETVTMSLTEYVLTGRRAAKTLKESGSDTGLASAVLDTLIPGSSIGKFFLDSRKVSAVATVKDAQGRNVTLSKPGLDALAAKLDVGTSYDQLLKDKYIGPGGQALHQTWKAAYKARMLADAQEASMRGEFDAYDDKTPYQWVQAVLETPDSSRRRQVGGHTIQTEEFTVDIWGSGPCLGSVRASYPVNGVLVIGATDSNGKPSRAAPSVVLYTPDAPDGRAFRTYLSRDAMKADPAFKKPEWVQYFNDRVSQGEVPVSRDKEMSRQDGIALYAHPNPQSGYSAKLNTKLITGDFTERLYQADVSMKRENAEALSVSNDELRRESLRERTNTAFDFMFDLADIVPFGKIAKGFKALGRLAKPRKLLDKLPGSLRLITKTDDAGKIAFASARRGNGSVPGPSLKECEIPISYDTLKGLKYSKADDIYTDGANNQYLRIGNHWYRTGLQPNADGNMQRGIFRADNSTNRIDVERFGDRWAVQQSSDRLLGGSREASSASIRLDNLARNLSNAPIDEQAIRRSGPELIDALSANGNRDTFRRVIDLQTAEGNLTLMQRAEILAEADPYQQARRYLDTYASQNIGADRAKLPDQLQRAIANGDDVSAASTTVERLLATDRQSLQGLTQRLSKSQLDAATFAPDSELQKLLQSPANQDTLRRVIDLQTAEGNLTLMQRAEILAEADPYQQARRYLDTYASQNIGADLAKLPDQLKRAIANGDDVSAASTTVERLLATDRHSLQGLTQRLSRSQLDTATFAVDSELQKLLQSPANQNTFQRLIDIQYYDGRLTTLDRLDILRETNPQERVRLYLQRFASMNVGSNRAKLPQDLQLAISRATNPGASQHGLARLAERLAGAPLDAPALRRNTAELIDLLGTEGNQDAFRRLIDLQTAEGNLTLMLRAEILAEAGPYQQARRYLANFASKNVGADLAKLPDQLKRAIANGDDVSAASTTVERLLATDRHSLQGLTQRLSRSQLDTATFAVDSELQKLLQSPANQNTFQRLIDIQYYDGRLTTLDRLDILRETNPQERVRLYLQRFASMNVGSNRAKLPQDLQLAISRATA
ncbi:hypothetical protein WL19_21520 [Burkholderia ubonensis]|nr:hypothetical protein WL19_21520 [Burkholderia ubonensis]